MTNEEYDAVVQQCMTLAGLCLMLDGKDVATALAMAERCDTTGPFVNPTLWRAASPRLDVIKKVMRATLTMWSNLPTKEECEKADADSEAIRKFSGI